MKSFFDRERTLSAAVAAANASQDVLLHHFGTADLEVEFKGDGSPVTVADKAAEREIRRVLGDLTPHIPVFGEEQGDDSPGADLTWVVDPIDGTISFVHGLRLFGTLIALWNRREDTVLVGVLNLPAMGEMFSAATGTGLLLNGEPYRTRPRTAGRTLVGMGDRAQFLASSCGDEFDLMCGAHPYVRGYTDAFGHAQVLQGGLDVMVDPGLKPWDLLASRCLLREAGLTMRRRRSRAGEGDEDVILGRSEEVEAMGQLLGWG